MATNNQLPVSSGPLSQFNSFGDHSGRTISDPVGYFSSKDNSALIASLDPGNRPSAPGTATLIDPETGLLRSPYNLPIDPNTGLLQSQYLLSDQYDTPYNQVLAQYREKALLPEDQQSAAAKVLQEQLGLQTSGQLENAQIANANNAAAARGQQARQGGISSAIMANLNRSSQKDLNRSLQDIRAQSAQAGLGITAQDLQNRQGLLQNLLGEESSNRAYLSGRQGTNIQNSLQAVGTNISNSLNEQNFQRQLAEQQYEEQMKAWAAGKQAQATAGSGGGGGGGKK